MRPYLFQTEEFGISDHGIHLLRSGFNYRTINFEEIKRIQIGKGKELHNWWIIFVIGAALIFVGAYLSVGFMKALISGNLPPRGARMIFLLFIPVAGAYFVYHSLQTGQVLKLECLNGTKEMFPLRHIAKAKKMKEFKTYLKEKAGSGFQIPFSE